MTTNLNLAGLFPQADFSSETEVRSMRDRIAGQLTTLTTCPFMPGNVALNADDNPAQMTVTKDGAVVIGSPLAAFIAANLFNNEEARPVASVATITDDLDSILQNLVREREARELHDRRQGEIAVFVETTDNVILHLGVVMTADDRASAIIRMLTARGYTEPEMTEFNSRLKDAEEALRLQNEGEQQVRRADLALKVATLVATMAVGEDAGKDPMTDTEFGLRVIEAATTQFGEESWGAYEESRNATAAAPKTEVVVVVLTDDERALGLKVAAVRRNIAGQPDNQGIGDEQLDEMTKQQTLGDATLGESGWNAYQKMLVADNAPKQTLEARPDNPTGEVDPNGAPLQAKDEGDDKPAADAPAEEGAEGAGVKAPGEGEVDPNAAPEPQPDAPQDQEARDAGAAEVPGPVVEQAAAATTKPADQPQA